MTKRSVREDIAGFSLVEMLAVLAITAIVFSIGAISLSALRGRLTPDHYADQIADMLNNTNDNAVERSREQRVTIHLKDKTFENGVDPGIRLPEDFRLKVIIGKEIVTEATELEVIFLPDGTCSGVEIEVAGAKGRSVHISTNWLTGLTRRADAQP